MKLLNSFRNRWQQCSQQQRTIIGLSSIAIIGVLLYIAVIAPLQNSINDLQSQWQSDRELANWMAPRVAFLKKQTAPRQVKAIAPTALLATLDAAVHQSELSGMVVEISQASKDSVQIRFKAVPFDSLLLWLTTQKTTYNIEVTQLSAQKVNKNEGLADVVVVLKIIGLTANTLY